MSHNLQKTHRAKAAAAKAPQPRYEIRWANGHWGIFDTEFYRMVELARPNLYKAAVELYNA
jgi:hypothetical protein